MARPPHPTRTRRLRGLLSLAGLVLLAACATPQPVEQVGLNRDTPEATYEYFKAVAQANQWAAEWAVFSPNFKRQLNQVAGRNVDLGDYTTARQTIARNSQADMALLLNSTLAGPARMVGPDRAVVTIAGGGRSVSPTLVRLTRWELKIEGEDQPATGFVTSPGEAVQVNSDGSITVRVQAPVGAAAYLRTIPRERIEGFTLTSEWYVDDFGGLDQALGTGAAEGEGAAAPTAPSAPPPTGSGSPDAGSVMGSGSPDG